MKILYLGSEVYGYELEIKKKLEEKNDVIYLNYMPSSIKLSILKVIKLFFGKKIYNLLLSHEINKCLKKSLKNTEKMEIDILFTVAWSLLKKENLLFLENFFSFKRKKLYLWDDVSKLKNFFEYRDYFDEVYSFDEEDCKKYTLKYRPTFYSERLKKSKKKGEINYIFSFIGEYSFRRANILKKIVNNYTNVYIHLYYNMYVYILKYLFNKEYKLKDIKFFKISREKYNQILQESKVVVDLINGKQTGVTQRTLDAVFLEKKIVTNNENIKLLPIYLENNVLIINENESIEEVSLKITTFLSTEYVKYSEEIINYYSLDKWVGEIFGKF